MNLRTFRSAILLVSTALAGCGGGAKVGEACDVEGQAGECEDGAVCGKTDTATECLKSCVEQTDCPASYECNGISGSSAKGCRPKDDTKK